ncbi:hypothetical protein PGT21_033492 [Puccinia graminis f. sp. tritici]|uniref:Uncharacterized protein n=1 Tax=Puccinia graminis f. sp. tritici TaxID=56615 RepID=A0A5B0R2S9_PUCGR|nr:hypothetical protein PGT21_033492 [Puccinia graminis f. sp. tritici]
MDNQDPTPRPRNGLLVLEGTVPPDTPIPPAEGTLSWDVQAGTWIFNILAQLVELSASI